MEVYGSPTEVRQKFAERFAGRDPPSRLTIYRVNIILTNPVYNDFEISKSLVLVAL